MSSCEDPEKVPSVDYYKEQAIGCLKRMEYKDAALYLTQAIQQEKSPNAELFCLRSRTYIKMKMLYLAYEDAEKAYMAKPNNPDAFICHGEIYMEAGCYEMALMFFGLAAEMNPMMEVTDELLNLVKRASVLGKRNRMITKRLPWVGAGVGIILGVFLMILDQLVPDIPFVGHPALMVLSVIGISLVSYGLAKAYLHYSKMQIAKRLSPPKSASAKVDEKKEDGSALDDSTDAANAETQTALKNRIRYSKAQARQRFKKGKF